MDSNGHETYRSTVLVVDDDEASLGRVAGILSKLHYNVLTAPSGDKGLEKSRGFKGGIGLMIADFHLPELSGWDLATAVSVDRPEIQVLLMSDLPKGVLVLNEGWHFLPKPFLSSQIAALAEELTAPHKQTEPAELAAPDWEPPQASLVQAPALEAEVARYRALHPSPAARQGL